MRVSLALAILFAVHDVLGITVSLNISCHSGEPSTNSSDACVLHSRNGFAIAGDSPIDVTLGSQMEVIHLQQTNLTAGTFDAPRWCVGSKSHLTKSGNFVLQFGEPGAECDSSSADLDVGDCFTSTHHDRAANGKLEMITVCFNGRQGAPEEETMAEVSSGVDYPTAGTNSVTSGGGGTCSYSYADHGGTPVVTSAKCTITKADLNTGNEPGTTTRAYARKLGSPCPNDDAGHILADRLGGAGTNPTNIMPQAPHLNRGAWEAFERKIAACMNGGSSKATLSWTWEYKTSADTRPTTMTYSSSYDTGCANAHQSFINTCQPTR